MRQSRLSGLTARFGLVAAPIAETTAEAVERDGRCAGGQFDYLTQSGVGEFSAANLEHQITRPAFDPLKQCQSCIRQRDAMFAVSFHTRTWDGPYLVC